VGGRTGVGETLLVGGSFVGALLSAFDEHDVKTAMIVAAIAIAQPR
jgi:hypothetical protein